MLKNEPKEREDVEEEKHRRVVREGDKGPVKMTTLAPFTPTAPVVPDISAVMHFII